MEESAKSREAWSLYSKIIQLEVAQRPSCRPTGIAWDFLARACAEEETVPSLVAQLREILPGLSERDQEQLTRYLNAIEVAKGMEQPSFELALTA